MKIVDIYALSAESSRYQGILYYRSENKLHCATIGKTAAEIIYSSAGTNKLYMAITNGKQGPEGKISKSDISIAKNYLSEKHIKELNRLISTYLDLAENRTELEL